MTHRFLGQRYADADVAGVGTSQGVAVQEVSFVFCRMGITRRLVHTSRRAWLVREPLGFTIRQARRRRELGRYRVRDSGLIVYLRHNTPDIETLDEIFRHGHYDLPRRVAATLPEAPHVVDLGANVGLFGVWLLGRYPQARVVGFEPDPANADVHESTIEANGLRERWRLVRACATARDGTVEFSGTFATGRIGDGGKSVPAVDVFPFLKAADLLKVDIEGGEWELLADSRFADTRTRAIALEYHSHRAPQGEPRAVAHELLRGAGYETADRQLFWPPGQGMIWAWKDR